MKVSRDRLDRILVDRGLAASRDRAQRLILAGEVFVAGQRVDKPGTQVLADAAVEVHGRDIPYVSRGGLKLDAALDHWRIDVTGLTAADLGASTGGFTDCLLQRGAEHVFAIDVGYGQLAWSLRQDPRVTLFERTNLRDFPASRLPRLAQFAVIDVSFISLTLILPTAAKLVEPGSRILPMVKPQFEAGRSQVGKRGVVSDPRVRQAAADKVIACATELGLECKGQFDSPVAGPMGNVEIFLHLIRP